MTRQKLEQQLKQKDAVRLQKRLRWVHNQGYSFQNLSTITGVPVPTISNLCYGRPKQTRNEDLKDWIDILYTGIKDGSIPSQPNDDRENDGRNHLSKPSRQPNDDRENDDRNHLIKQSRQQHPDNYKYKYADNLLSKKEASDYALAIEGILHYGTSYRWIADQIGSHPAIIFKIHIRRYFDAVQPSFASLPQLFQNIERGNIIPPKSMHRPRLDPRIFAKCHDQLKYLLTVFSRAELSKKLDCSYQTLHNFLTGRTEAFGYLVQVEKLYREVNEQRNQNNVFKIPA